MAEDVLDSLLADWSGHFNKTDDYLGDLLAAPGPVGLGGIIKYDHLRGRWLIWNGVRWRPDLTEQVNDMSRIRAGEWMASKKLNEEDKKALLPIFDVGKKSGVLKSLRSREKIAMEGNEWDTNGYMVGFDNGVMDLKARKFLTAEPAEEWQGQITSDLLISKSVRSDFDPYAECPTFEWFLNDIMAGDADLVAYLKRMLGYSLIGTQSEQKFWMWVGRGSNGKGILARTIDNVFGDYSETPADTLYMRSKLGSARSDTARPDLMRLQAARFTYMSEPPGNQFNEELLKAHTGEDMILARDLYGRAGQMAQFTPTHKIVFLTNDPPKTDDVGTSMRRRVRVIRFDRDYQHRPDAVLDDGTVIESRLLEDVIKSERAGILNLAVTEAFAWIKEGMPEPQKVLDWSNAYIEENDPLATFINERCEVGRGLSGPSNALWGSYEDWAAQSNVESMSRTGFGMALGRRYNSKHTKTGAVYLGIRAKSAVELAGE